MSTLWGAACNVSLVRHTSRKPCTDGAGYGCSGHAMWIGKGCRGTFDCNGHRVTCGSSGLILRGDPPRHHCTCAPWQRGGLFRAPGAEAVPELPSWLSEGAPRLIEGKLGQARFVPGSTNETLTATFALWNVLDAMMALAMPNYAWQTGYVRELQLRRMVELAKAPGVSTYCEIGFNGGHSSAAMLLANPALTVHAFDLMMWEYSNSTAALLRATFGRRFRLHRGDSRKLVPEWTRTHRHACDVSFVDGDHSTAGAMIDMLNMRNATAPTGVAVADDINSDPGVALETLRALGHLNIAESYGPFDAPHKYNPCMRSGTYRSPVCSAWGFAVFAYARTPPPFTPELQRLLNEPYGTHGKSAASAAARNVGAMELRTGGVVGRSRFGKTQHTAAGASGA